MPRPSHSESHRAFGALPAAGRLDRAENRLRAGSAAGIWPRAMAPELCRKPANEARDVASLTSLPQVAWCHE